MVGRVGGWRLGCMWAEQIIDLDVTVVELSE